MAYPWSEAFKTIVDADPRPVLIAGRQGEILEASPSACRLLRARRDELIRRIICDLAIRSDVEGIQRGLQEALQGGRAVFEAHRLKEKGSDTRLRLTAAGIPREDGEIVMIFAGLISSPSPGGLDLDQAFIRQAACSDFLRDAAGALQRLSGCRCAGIRIMDSEGNIPYAAVLGFPEGFLRSEDRISIGQDNCACTRAFTGDYQLHDLPLLSENGSFQVNAPEEYVFSLHPQLQREYRSACWQVGFQTVAAIPVRDNGQVLGVIHLADERPGQAPAEKILLLEEAAGRTGEYIHRYAQIEQMK